MADMVPLGELISIRRGTTYKSALLGRPGPYLLGLASIARNGGFRSDSLKTYGGESPESLLVKPGELFASLKDVTQAADLLGSVARLPHDEQPGRLTQDTVRLDVVSDRVERDYLYWLLRTPEYRQYCRAHATGTTNLGLPREDFLGFPVRLPRLGEQRRVAEVLGALDDLIDTNERLADRFWSSAEAVFERTQNSASVQVALGEVIELKYGKALPADSRRPGGVPVVSSAGISGAHDTALVEGPGVVVGRKGSVGSVTWVDADFFPIDTAFYVHGDRVPMSWAYFLLQSLPLDSMNTDSAVPGLNRANALALRVRVPDSDVLRDFDVVASELIGGARGLRAENEQLRRTRDELLPLLMSGAVRARPEGVAA